MVLAADLAPAGKHHLHTTALTASLVRTDGAVGKKAWLYGTLLLATIALAGMVTYYYHLHEPTDEDDRSDQPATITKAQGGTGGFACPERAREAERDTSTTQRLSLVNSARK